MFLGCFSPPLMGVTNAAGGNAHRRVRNCPSPQAEMPIAAAGVWKRRMGNSNLLYIRSKIDTRVIRKQHMCTFQTTHVYFAI